MSVAVFSVMHKYLMAARRLTDAETIELLITANTLGAKYPVMYPTRQISPKLHIMCIHVPVCSPNDGTV